MDRNKILDDIEEIFEICQERNIGSNETELDIKETITDYIVKKLTLTDVVKSLKDEEPIAFDKWCEQNDYILTEDGSYYKEPFVYFEYELIEKYNEKVMNL